MLDVSLAECIIKISMFSHVAKLLVFGIHWHDLTSVYHVALLLQSQGIVEFLTRWLELERVTVSDEIKGWASS